MSQKQDEQDEAFRGRLATVGTAALVAWVLALLAYLIWFRGLPLSDDPGRWAEFGDYLGGVVNPIIGLATVLLIMFSISLQLKEHRATRQELHETKAATQKMAFEQSFFSWLSSYDSLISQIELNEHDRSISGGHLRVYKGRAALRRWLYKQTSFEVLHMELGVPVDSESPNGLENAHGYMEDALLRDVDDEKQVSIVFQLMDIVLDGYARVYAEHQSDLGVLFRTLYRLVLWIDEQELSTEEKWHYVALVRARLTQGELMAILFQMLSGHAKRFAKLANKYSLFDNAGSDSDLIVRTACRYLQLSGTSPKGEPIGLTPQAFDSELGRSALGLPVT